MGADEIHLRHCILYEYNKGHNATTAAKNICKVLGYDIVNVRKCQRWYSRFKSGNLDLKDVPRPGGPCRSDPEDIRKLLETNPYLSTRQISRKLNMAHSTVHRHLKALKKTLKDGAWISQDEVIDDEYENSLMLSKENQSYSLLAINSNLDQMDKKQHESNFEKLSFDEIEVETADSSAVISKSSRTGVGNQQHGSPIGLQAC